MTEDTIAAISTPLGQGGIGIVRLSGPRAAPIARRIFTGPLHPRRLVLGHILDPETSQKVDEALVAYMAAPHTYTREDVVEINCHGGPLPLQRVLELVLRQGARLAHPGEFTLRAFLHGRLDLAQAEAVLDIVQARTAAGLRLAVQGLEGRLSQKVKGLRKEIMGVLAYLTARIDFPEDEIEEQDALAPLEKAKRGLEELLQGADAGIIYRQGVRAAIVGRPNVGKSSLLNALLQKDRAITSPIPGTTRDTLEETVNIQGIPFILVDTAGLGETGDPLSAQSLARSREALEQADLNLLVVDSSQPLTAEDRGLFQRLQGRPVLLVANKSDLPRQADVGDLPWPAVFTSALTGQGLAELEAEMAQQVMGGQALASDSLLVTTPRHKEALALALANLSQAIKASRSGLPDDLVTIDLTLAASALGEITGETVQEELLETIFSQFCVGK